MINQYISAFKIMQVDGLKRNEEPKLKSISAVELSIGNITIPKQASNLKPGTYVFVH